MGGVRDGDRQPELRRDPLQILVEARERGDPPVDGLGGLGVGEHEVAEGLDLGDGDHEQPGGFLGPGDPERLDEGHDVLAVGALRVLRGPACDPAFEDLGDGVVEAADLAFDGRGVAAEENRRQCGDHDQIGCRRLIHDPTLGPRNLNPIPPSPPLLSTGHRRKITGFIFNRQRIKNRVGDRDFSVPNSDLLIR